MIKLNSVTIKNFLSIGNNTQSVQLDTDQLTLVLGENIDLGGEDSGNRNGVGKSSLFQAISYALFGQSLSGIKKDNLINKTNAKNMLVTCDFSINGKKYRIERGRKPGILKFLIDEVEQVTVDQSMGDSAETQLVINKLLGMTHIMFKNIVLLNTYTEPFLNMSVGDQRIIIEQLLGITLLTEKADKLREQMKTTKELICKEDMRIVAVQNANKRLQEQIDSTKRRQKMWLAKHKEDEGNLTIAINELSNINITEEIQNHKNQAQYNSYLQEIKELNSNLDRKKSDLQKDLKSIEKLKKEISSLNENTCYACGQSVHNHQDQIVDKEQSLTSAQTSLTSLKADIVTFNMKILNLKVIEKPTVTWYDNVNDAIEHKSNLENLKQQLMLKQQEIDPYSEQIEDMNIKGLEEIKFDTMNGLKRIQDHEDFLLKLLTNKDSFIRKQIINQNLTFLNSRLSYYLYKLGLPHTVVFQNDLSVTITEFGRDLDWGNLSRGEASRTILSLSLSFRDVWESLYQPINLLSLDEMLDSGIDTAGVENAMGILKHMSRDKKRSVWLVSHREELASRVNSTVVVTKENGFSQFHQDK